MPKLSKKKPVYFFLFNDLALITKKKSPKYKLLNHILLRADAKSAVEKVDGAGYTALYLIQFRTLYYSLIQK